MIQIEAVEVQEMRGIRTLKVFPNRKSFVISGPNGSGKSGVVDAIQFALTGDISRLSGKGTVGLTVQRHGPHVDKRDDPGAAEVALTLFEPESKKTFVLRRNVKTWKTFTLTPEDAKLRKVVEEVAKHRELTLSRREIIKFILVESGTRSKEIQELLQLHDVGNIRRILYSVKNRLNSLQTAAEKECANAEDALRRHLDLKVLAKAALLASVNPKRKLLGLPELTDFTSNTNVDEGVIGGGTPAFNKEAALRDIEGFVEVEPGLETLEQSAVTNVLMDLGALETDPALLEAVTRRSFVEQGLALVDGPSCPLCETAWVDVQELKAHLAQRLAKSEEAEALQKRLLENAAVLAGEAKKLIALIAPIEELAQADAPELASELSTWKEQLEVLARSLGTVDDVIRHKGRLEQGWVDAPVGIGEKVAAYRAALNGKPDQSASVVAQTFLALAQDRLARWRTARRAEQQAKAAAQRGQDVYRAYCDAAEEQLAALYDAVEEDFSGFYRQINADDEGAFKARLEPSEGKLDLEVAFYDKGMFPPAAYHSEGHQDGMGVCLYLALMKRVLGDRFRFAVLDDVVMSVDQGHRKQFCALLKTRFPNTQFIITTHDRVWAKQMQTEGVVDSKGGVVFHGWSVETGPIFAQTSDTWEQIEKELEKDDVPTAAARLRRYLENVSAELADQLGAKPAFRGDFSYDLGDLLPAVIGRHGELLKMAAKSASDWNDDAAKTRVEQLRKARAVALEKYGDENWAVNKAVHYTEWAEFTKAEFQAVVDAFKTLLSQLRCPKAGCESWLYIAPRKGSAETLRCRCATTNLNLLPK